jgi:hypothetical protein
MKKIIIILCVVIALSSCSNYPKNIESLTKNIIFWDETMSKEQCIGIYIVRGLSVTSYNGISVTWGTNVVLYLPPGRTTLTFDANYYYGNTRYYGKDVPFQWTFNAGETRYLQGWARDGSPVILVVDPNDSTRYYEQEAYKIPSGGRTVLQ